MFRQETLLRALLCALLPLVLLAPLAGQLASQEHLCACGMKKSSCFCELIAGKMSNGGHCAGSCSLRPQRDMGGPPRPGLHLDSRDSLGIFARLDFAVAPTRSAGPLEVTALVPSSPAHPPEPPPPRASFRVT